MSLMRIVSSTGWYRCARDISGSDHARLGRAYMALLTSLAVTTYFVTVTGSIACQVFLSQRMGQCARTNDTRLNFAGHTRVAGHNRADHGQTMSYVVLVQWRQQKLAEIISFVRHIGVHQWHSLPPVAREETVARLSGINI